MREAEIAVAFDPDGPNTLVNAACTCALLGLKVEAIAMLQRAVQNGYWHADFLQRDPDLDTLRKEPEFQRLLAGLRNRHAS